MSSDGTSSTDLSNLLSSIAGFTTIFEDLFALEVTAANSATVQAENASTFAAAAATSASNAGTYGANASTAATQATTQAGNAVTEAIIAQSAATSASNSATAAAASAATAQAAANSAANLNTLYEFSTSGGTLTLSTVNAAAGIIWVQGALTSNLTLVMPATVHPFILDNATTGPWTVTVQMTGGANAITVGQGNANQLYCDGSTGIYSVSSVSGLQFNGVKPVTTSATVLGNTNIGAYTYLNKSGSNTISLPASAGLQPGAAVYLDNWLGTWTVSPNGSDTADFGASITMRPNDKMMFSWTGSGWRTTLYTNQQSPVFSVSVTAPVALITRGVFGGVADDGTTAVQATTGRFTTSLQVPTMAPGDNSTNASSTAFVYAAINALIGGAPGNLDTLNELATAINDDTSFAATVTNLIAAKAAISGQTFTGQVVAPSLVATGGYVSAYGWGSNAQNGMLYLSQNGANYLLWDGTNYNMPNGNLKVNGSAVWTAATFTPANYAALAGAATFGGAVTGTAQVGALKATSTGTNQTSIQLLQPGAITDQKTWELIFQANGVCKLRSVNDAYTSEADAFAVTRTATGYAIATMQVVTQGGRFLVGAVTDDTYTPTQVANGVAIQRVGGGGQQLMLSSGSLNFLPGSTQTNNEITSYSATGNAKYLVLNATTDTLDTPLTAGTLGISFMIYSKAVATFGANGCFFINDSADDGTSKLQINGNIRIYGTSNGITFPDGTQQLTGYAVTAPTVQSYTPTAGTTTIATQTYGLGLIVGFMNGALMVPGTDYTATTGNSVTLTNAANGRTTYTFMTGALFNASNVLQPQVAQVTGTVGNTTLTLPFSAQAGYLWIFQGGAWLAPIQDFTFAGGTSVTLTAAPTQSTDSFTVISLQPVSFANCATQTNVQGAQLTFAMDTGAVNAYAVTYIPAVGVPTNGMQLSFFVSHTNTGASTLACNGGTAYPIWGNAHGALTGGELVAAGFVEVVFSSALGCWLLLENSSGTQQMGNQLNFTGATPMIQANGVTVTPYTVGTGSVTMSLLPNATGAQSAAYQYYTNLTTIGSVTNASYCQYGSAGGAHYINSGNNGSAALLGFQWRFNGTTYLNLDTTGRLTTGPTGFTLPSYAQGKINIDMTSAPVTDGMNIRGNGVNNMIDLYTASITGSSYTVMSINYNGSYVGGINMTSTTTSFVTSSDYRLKKNVVKLDGAIDRLMRLRPKKYLFVHDEEAGEHEGFIAHELQEEVPCAVTGEKDAVRHDPVFKEGYDPQDVQPEDVLDVERWLIPQGVDYSKVVPLLTAALQEAITEIRVLKVQVAELKKQKR